MPLASHPGGDDRESIAYHSSYAREAKNFRDEQKTRKVTKNPWPKKTGIEQQTRLGESNTLPSPIPTVNPQRVRKKRRVSAILTSIQIHEFDFMFSCPVLQFDLRVFMNMDIWFSFYLYPWRCDVTRYIRTFIYLHNTSLSEWMPDGAWPFLDGLYLKRGTRSSLGSLPWA